MPLISSHTYSALETEFTLSGAAAPAQSQDSNGCASGREIVLEDGTKKCRNCADCPKKVVDSMASSVANSRRGSGSDSDESAAPRVLIEIED